MYESTSWWSSLHDAYVESFASSRFDRTATLFVRVDHLAESEETGYGAHFELRFNVVRAVHLAEWEAWTPIDSPTTITNDQLLKGRTYSVVDADFATPGLRIAEAAVCSMRAKDLIWPRVEFTEPTTPVKLFTLDVDGSESEDSGDVAMAIVFEDVSIFREGEPISEETFHELGEAFWRKLSGGGPRERLRYERATLDDRLEIVEIFRTTRASELPYLPILHMSDEDLEYFGSIIQKSTVYVARDNGWVVGFCAFRTDWVDHLYVRPSYSRLGIGRTFLEKAKAAHPRLQLWVFQKNAAARAFYEAMGFTLVKLADGADNEEREPDALYQWPAPFEPGSVIDVQ